MLLKLKFPVFNGEGGPFNRVTAHTGGSIDGCKRCILLNFFFGGGSFDQMMVYYVFTNEDIFHLKALHVAFSSGGCFSPQIGNRDAHFYLLRQSFPPPSEGQG